MRNLNIESQLQQEPKATNWNVFITYLCVLMSIMYNMDMDTQRL